VGRLQRTPYPVSYESQNPKSLFGCLTCKKFVCVGVNFAESHANNLSENIFPTKDNCARLLDQNRVGGYMKGVGWSH
jgi:hypothetical protein